MGWKCVLIIAATLLSCSACQAATRRYYIQAEKRWWSFADGIEEPSEQGLYIDRCTGFNYTDGAELYMQIGVGSRYLMARYIRYTDETFTTEYDIPPEEEHLNVVGPMLRVEEGDTLEVVLSNTLDFDTSLIPFGVIHSANDTEGVPTNETYTYSWNITSDMAPGSGSQSSKLWMYRSWIDDTIQQNMGLLGPLIVTRKGSADPQTAKPMDTDMELFALFHVFDQNINLFFNETLEYYNMTDNYLEIANVTDAMWEEANLMHSINGKMFCWNAGFTVPANSRARWHVAVLGSEADIHNFHWHGMVLNSSGMYQDQISLFSGNTWSADMVMDNPGTWLLHCHVNDHIHAGMVGLYTLEGEIKLGDTLPNTGDTIQYYIASNEVEWDYAPFQMDMCGNDPQNLTDDAAAQLVPNNYTLTIGSKQMKAIFEEYTDATFTVKKPKDLSLGLLGPTLRAKIGDTIKVTFKNNCGFTTSLHPHGVFYEKNSEGSPYNDGTSNELHLDDHVHQGLVHNYTWYVTERASPAPQDGSSVMWMYHSHTHEIQDSYAGLMGAIIVVNPDMATSDNRPTDVDREYVLSYSILNEQSSFMLRQNLAKYMPSIPELQYNTLAGTITSFQDQENFHVINGYTFCNGPSFNATTGEKVRFYIQSLGTEADLHTPSTTLQWTQRGHRSSALLNLAGQMQTADIIPRAAGDFLLQCRTAEHVDAGMIAKFHVEDSGKDLLSAFNGTERFYYISANEVMWNYIPEDTNVCSGEDFDDEVSANWGNGTLGKIFRKAVYQGYTDDSFTDLLPETDAQGMAGPTIHAEVGDKITVVFQNNLTFEANLQLNGGFVPLHNESLIDSPVEMGDTVTYSWLVQDDNGPASGDMSTIAFVYGSNVDPTANLNAGLYGATVIASPGTLTSSGLPKGVDAEQALFYFGIDESASSLFETNLALTNFTVPDEDQDYDDFTAWQPTVAFYPINGYSWCNLSPIQLNLGDTVRWYVIGLGGETGLHTPLFENGILLAEGDPLVTTNIAPTVTAALDMKATAVGSWNFWDDVQEHYEGGMIGKYEVSDANAITRDGSTAD